MNSLIEEDYPLFELYQSLRDQLMEQITDEDLQFRLGGDTESLGALCQRMGETQVSYIQSFKEFRQDFSFRSADAGLSGSVDKLKVWFGELDRELKAVIGALTEEDLRDKFIDRGGDFKVSPRIQLEIYKEALLIFYGKASVYLKALGREPSKQWKSWIE